MIIIHIGGKARCLRSAARKQDIAALQNMAFEFRRLLAGDLRKHRFRQDEAAAYGFSGYHGYAMFNVVMLVEL
ncbi:hypothetical protein UU5_16689 [Rhodanobacter sp. 115]|nr:hypothetical protein UU5_16689 [Rhodanobacter sp. 115]